MNSTQRTQRTARKATRSQAVIRKFLIKRVAFAFPRTVLGIRVAVAAWLVALGLFVLVNGYWWGLALEAAAVFVVWYGRQVYAIAMRERPAGRSPQVNGS